MHIKRLMPSGMDICATIKVINVRQIWGKANKQEQKRNKVENEYLSKKIINEFGSNGAQTQPTSTTAKTTKPRTKNNIIYLWDYALNLVDFGVKFILPALNCLKFDT